MHIIERTRRQTYVPMLRDSNTKSVVCKCWVVLWYFSSCDSFTCLPASTSIVKLRLMLSCHLLKTVMPAEIIGSWLSTLSCMKLVPLFLWVPGCCIRCTPYGSTLDMFSSCSLPRQADLQVSFPKLISHCGTIAELSGNVLLVSVLCY